MIFNVLKIMPHQTESYHTDKFQTISYHKFLYI